MRRQSDGSVAYTLPDCIHAALANSPDLSAAAADLAGARARLGVAHAGRYGQAEYTQILGFVNHARGNPVFSPDSKNDVLSVGREVTTLHY